jgi:hypothetical protein
VVELGKKDGETGGYEDLETGEIKDEVSGRIRGRKLGEKIKTHEDLDGYQLTLEAAMKIFGLSKKFPVKERYSLTDQVRRSSRSVCANLAEAWRKRRYKAAFIAKLNDCEVEAAETQVWR